MKIFYLIIIIIFPFLSHSQETMPDTANTTCVQRDLPDVLRDAFHKHPKEAADSKGSILLIPIIGSNPSTGFMVGLGGQYAFKRPGEYTKYSMLSGSVQLTTKDQKLFLLKNSVFSKNNKFFFSGDWRYQVFSQSTYGLGTNAPEGGILDYQLSLAGQPTNIDSLAQPLKYNFLRFYQSVSYNIARSFYIGIGYYLDSYSKIEDEKLRLSPGDSLITSHYAYSGYYGFNEKKYSTSVLGINLVSDTRDNMINAYKGHFAMISWHSSLGIFDSKASNFFSMEWRSFHPLSSRNPRHLLAFWMMGDFTPVGNVPYLILPATAYDQRSRSGRGYTQGRYRGNQLMYGESEYRFPISKCGGVLGGALFINATSANNPQQSLDLFESIKPGYGLGLRAMVDKKTRTNLSIDVGFGQKSVGFYLSASETF